MRKLIGIILTFLGFSNLVVAEEKQFPPVPKWKPDFSASIESQLERMIYYTNQEKDLAQFANGTIVIVKDGLDDSQAKQYAVEVLSKIINYHPDMNPVNMKDGNILVQYNHPAYNVVLTEFTEKHIEKIKSRHLEALATDEILITALGQNKFDVFGMQALYGRAFMFMDAQNPKVVQLYRRNSSNQIKADI
ncbi:hypothetical protein H0A36_30025 [Endozoicomonas sp. SM1973]|uniref:Uncharacterized protein n=1 Tax=Spartinivicinus marinus TaxID=2994442 RepID=A0A853IAB8_9GAMM|nr:hypothetical protein [Spartinivicinus marinus]NYZ70253.1 hypothetical protein [Spartinivicinus marinus]